VKSILHPHKICFLLFATILFLLQSLYSQNSKTNSNINKSWISQIPFERKAFIENKGQFENILPEGKKNFNYCIDKGYQVFFYTNEISYRFTKYIKCKETLLNVFDSEEKRERREHQYKREIQFVNVKWLNANPNPIIELGDKQNTYYSYFISDGKEKPYTIMCNGYSKLTYKNLYNGIDVEYIFHPDEGVEYNLLVHPGADISQVKMQYNGTQKAINKQNNIHISTMVGDIVDHAPITFYADNKEEITSSFNITNNIVSFNIAAYSKNRELVIDPWTVVPGYTPSKAFDNGVDATGNIYIYGGIQGNYVVEKYNSTGGAPIWSLVNSISNPNDLGGYYGDMLVENSGNFYLSQGFVNGGAHTFKFSPTSSLIWQSTIDPNYQEHWRLALNCITNKVIVAGGGTTTPTLNIAEIDVNTGVLVNAISAFPGHEDVAGLCVDDLGKSYLAGAVSNNVAFTNNTNNTVGSVSDGYGLAELAIPSVPTYYSRDGFGEAIGNGYNMMALGGTTFLFTSDGSTVKKWDRNTYALLASSLIPGGQAGLCSGVLADKCNNLFVGSVTGVYRFDFNLAQKEFHATTAAVYDIAFSQINSDIVTSGNGFLTPLTFGRESCVNDTLLILSTNPCNSSINTVTVRPTEGVPPYFFLWDDGSTDSVRTNLSVGVHIVTVRDAECVPSFHTDSVKIVNAFVKTKSINPSCHSSSNGQITIMLLKNETITGAVWTPSVSNSQPNDSTVLAVNLPTGIYHCHFTSNTGCTFDTSITLTAPPILQDSLRGRGVKCQGDANGSAKVFAYGGMGPYTYSWNSTPVQTTQVATNLVFGKRIVTITDSNSCVKTDSILIGSNPQPIVSFNTPAVCFGDSSLFTNTSSVSSGSLNSVWLFGHNGDSATTRNTHYFYPLCGNYMAKLTVKSDSGCLASVTDTVLVACKPSATFTVNNVCTYQAAAFNNTSTGATSYSWDFDYNTGVDNTTASPTHTYTPGTYNVQLVARSTTGCYDTVVHSIKIYSKPNANFSSNNPCFGQSTQFTDSSVVVNDTISAWLWSFGNGIAPVTAQNPVYTYLSSGTYPVSLIVTTNHGCLDTVQHNEIVHPLPKAGFSAPNRCDGFSVPLNSSSTITPPDVIQLYAWNFGDTTPVNTSQITSHLYASAGSYPVQLVTVSNFGCRDSITKTIIINPNPIVKFSANDTAGCSKLCLSFSDLSHTVPGSSVVHWIWNVGDGSTTNTSQNFDHCYTNASVSNNAYFTVSLTITSDSGCVSSISKNNYITVYPNPNAKFTVDPQTIYITEPVVSFTNLSTGADFQNWNFGDLTTSSSFSPPSHIYPDTGMYVIKLVTTTQYGCIDSTFQTITIEPDFTFYIPNAFTPNGDLINDTFNGKGTFIKKYEMSIFDRWGNFIFYTDDINKPWDGKANGGENAAQQDVYVYVVQVLDIKNKKHNYRGIVTLVR
jgi:gliding motility-associated-like protein